MARFIILGAVVFYVLSAAPAAATHDDSTPIGLRVTITGVNPSTGAALGVAVLRFGR